MRTMKKRILSVVLAALMVVSCLATGLTSKTTYAWSDSAKVFDATDFATNGSGYTLDSDSKFIDAGNTTSTADSTLDLGNGFTASIKYLTSKLDGTTKNFYASNEAGEIIDANGNTFTNADGEVITIENAYATDSTSTKNENYLVDPVIEFTGSKRLSIGKTITSDGAGAFKYCVSFTTTAPATLTIYWVSAKDGRQMAVYAGSDTSKVYAQTTETGTANYCYKSVITLDAADTYYVGSVKGNASSAGGNYIFGLVLEEQLSGETEVSFKRNAEDIWELYLNDVASTDTGVYTNPANGLTFYVNNGLVDGSFTGVAADKYFKRSIFQSDFTGIAKDGDTWKYFKNGEFDATKTGFVENGDAYWYVSNGIVDLDFTAVVMDSEVGAYAMVTHGRLASNWTGLATISETWTYFNNGVADTSYTGFVDNGGKTWYVENGALDLDIDGVRTVGTDTYYIRYGKVDTNRTGLVLSNGEFLYMVSGVLKKDYTGIVSNAGNQWYIVDGKLSMVDTDYTDNGVQYTIKNGKVTSAIDIDGGEE
ncbi:MAG: hypothetical protein ACI4EV_00320 [Lachnospiraceae bacterium]